MEHVVVERTFEDPVEYAKIEELAKKASWCLEQNRVRFLRSYFSTDKKRMICVYEAPDAESVRRANRQAKIPFDRVWTGSIVGPDTGV